ncbi:lipoprotein [Streptomyces lavendulae subsp. lavendulae]|nr:lipoprotein [Streptomyces lavendulae subsp. lavendulae]
MNTNRSRPRRAALAATAVAAGLVLAACGGDNTTNTAGSAPATATAPAPSEADRHNEADVAFAQGMIPHHRQAILMSDMVAAHGASPDVKALAEKIKKAQAPEIETMTGWLKAWGEKVPTGVGMDGMDHGDESGMPGMMDDQDMDRLGKARGNVFDTMFLTMMIDHHEGDIAMANTEKQQGVYGPAKALADDIITSQTAEITQMRSMLKTG